MQPNHWHLGSSPATCPQLLVPSCLSPAVSTNMGCRVKVHLPFFFMAGVSGWLAGWLDSLCLPTTRLHIVYLVFVNASHRRRKLVMMHIYMYMHRPCNLPPWPAIIEYILTPRVPASVLRIQYISWQTATYYSTVLLDAR